MPFHACRKRRSFLFAFVLALALYGAYWLSYCLSAAVFGVPAQLPRLDAALRVFAIETPLIVLLAVLTAAATLGSRWPVLVLSAPSYLVFALNTSNLLLIRSLKRTLTFYDLSYAADVSFFTGSAVAELFSLTAFCFFWAPALILAVYTRWIRARPPRPAPTFFAIVLCVVSVALIRRIGYTGSVSRTYAGAASLYSDYLLNAGERKRMPLSAAELQQFRVIRDSLFFPTAHACSSSAAPGANIVVVVLESFTNDFVGLVHERKSITPNLDRIAEKSLVFTRFYANSWRTSRALWSILSGELDAKNGLIFRDAPAIALPTIVSRLNSLGYRNHFFHGNSASFDNRGAFLRTHGFHGVHDREAFPDSLPRGGWGIVDCAFMPHAFSRLDSIARKDQPFFAIVLTLSNHHPFSFPNTAVPFPQAADTYRKILNGHAYTDRAVGMLYDSLSTRDWFANTALLITADNGAIYRKGDHESIDIANGLYRIPCLLRLPDGRTGSIDRPASHVDLASTILALAGAKVEQYGIGIPLFCSDGRGIIPINSHGAHDAAVVNGRLNFFSASASSPLSGQLCRYLRLWNRGVFNGQAHLCVRRPQRVAVGCEACNKR